VLPAAAAAAAAEAEAEADGGGPRQAGRAEGELLLYLT